MKTLFLIALIMASTMAVTLRQPTNAQIQRYDNLRNSNKWAGVMLKLAELSMQSSDVSNAVEELIDAIEKVVEDVTTSRENAAIAFQERTAKHEADVAFLNGLINSALEDIASTTDLLQNFLYPQKASLEGTIASLQRTIEESEATIEEETQVREREHQEYLLKVEETEQAREAVEEAKARLSELFDEPSLLQIKKAQKSIKSVTEKIGNSVEASLVKALIQLTTDQFSDQDKVRQVDDLLARVLSNLVENLAKLIDTENTAQNDFENLVTQLTDLINRSQLDLGRSNQLLEETEQAIEYNEEFLAQRQRDEVDLRGQLDEENRVYAEAEAIYWDLDAQFQDELDGCASAIQVLQDSSITGYIGDRISQKSDVIIDTAHGTGITVEKDPFDFE